MGSLIKYSCFLPGSGFLMECVSCCVWRHSSNWLKKSETFIWTQRHLLWCKILPGFYWKSVSLPSAIVVLWLKQNPRGAPAAVRLREGVAVHVCAAPKTNCQSGSSPPSGLNFKENILKVIFKGFNLCTLFKSFILFFEGVFVTFYGAPFFPLNSVDSLLMYCPSVSGGVLIAFPLPPSHVSQ